MTKEIVFSVRSATVIPPLSTTHLSKALPEAALSAVAETMAPSGAFAIEDLPPVTVTALGTITFNGNAFAKAMANPNNDEAQQNLGAALYNYGAAAKTCFGA